MYVQKYFGDRNLRKTIINTVSEIDDEVGRTVLRYGCGLYTEGQPQEITVVGESEEWVNYLNKKIWG